MKPCDNSDSNRRQMRPLGSSTATLFGVRCDIGVFICNETCLNGLEYHHFLVRMNVVLSREEKKTVNIGPCLERSTKVITKSSCSMNRVRLSNALSMFRICNAMRVL